MPLALAVHRVTRVRVHHEGIDLGRLTPMEQPAPHWAPPLLVWDGNARSRALLEPELVTRAHRTGQTAAELVPWCVPSAGPTRADPETDPRRSRLGLAREPIRPEPIRRPTRAETDPRASRAERERLGPIRRPIRATLSPCDSAVLTGNDRYRTVTKKLSRARSEHGPTMGE